MPEAYKGGVRPIGNNGNAGGGDREKKVKAGQKFEKRVTLPMLISWINQQNYDEYTKKELIRKVSAYPYSSFKSFIENIDTHIIKVRQEKERLRKEQDERERMSVQMSMQPKPRVDEGSITTKLPGIECFNEGSTAGVPGSDAGSGPEKEETSDGESSPSALPS